MKKEIKFRAWDNYGKSWLNDNISIALSGQKYYNHRDNGTFEKIEDALQDLADTVIVMQYTGLKDKNGIEIYEGDIVRTPFDVFTIEYGKADFSFVFWVKSLNDWMSLPYLVGLDNFEVIGNIYEHPHLLEA